jgi:hypothetical protein
MIRAFFARRTNATPFMSAWTAAERRFVIIAPRTPTHLGGGFTPAGGGRNGRLIVIEAGERRFGKGELTSRRK